MTRKPVITAPGGLGYRNRIVGHAEVDPTQLLANPANWRIHPHEQELALGGVLSEVGWVQEVIVNQRTGFVVDGHLRVAHAIARAEATVPVVYVDLDAAEEAKVLATLDPLAAMAGRDDEQMARLLGEHRLLCGDATNALDVARLLDGAKPHLCVTDPPYGVSYDPSWRNVEAARGHLAYAARRVGKVANDDRADWREAWALFPGDVIYSWHPPGATSLVHAAALQDSGFALRMQIIWAKSNFPIGRGDYHVRHEPCWYAVREGKPSHRTDDRTQTTLWEINLDRNVEGGHSTQKPVECMERPIRNHEAAEVYDPFLGSGTSIVACEHQRRRCYALEIDPAYVDVAVRRWETLTGKTAVHDGG